MDKTNIAKFLNNTISTQQLVYNTTLDTQFRMSHNTCIHKTLDLSPPKGPVTNYGEGGGGLQNGKRGGGK